MGEVRSHGGLGLDEPLAEHVARLLAVLGILGVPPGEGKLVRGGHHAHAVEAVGVVVDLGVTHAVALDVRALVANRGVLPVARPPVRRLGRVVVLGAAGHVHRLGGDGPRAAWQPAVGLRDEVAELGDETLGVGLVLAVSVSIAVAVAVVTLEGEADNLLLGCEEAVAVEHNRRWRRRVGAFGRLAASCGGSKRGEGKDEGHEGTEGDHCVRRRSEEDEGGREGEGNKERGLRTSVREESKQGESEREGDAHTTTKRRVCVPARLLKLKPAKAVTGNDRPKSSCQAVFRPWEQACTQAQVFPACPPADATFQPGLAILAEA